MSIQRITIRDYKSIHECSLAFKDINLLIGENGSGKSNIIDALTYFYRSLGADVDSTDCYNFNNKYTNHFQIDVCFDFRHLKSIAAHHLKNANRSRYQPYYDWIIRRPDEEILSLQKMKDKPSRWNKSRQYRLNINNLFPLYTVDARQVNLSDWSALWQKIGDLFKTQADLEQRLKEQVQALLKDTDDKTKNLFFQLDSAFSKANIKLASYTPQQYASAFLKLLLQGEEFELNNFRLQYASNGTNAFNYTNLLIEILKLLSSNKLKEPFVLLDEPEISLHHKLIDQLTDRIFHCNGAPRFLAATHSPRFLKNILRMEEGNCCVIHVTEKKGSTVCGPVSLFQQDQRLRHFMTDQHANAYFSKYILSVEGASELELFHNKYLQAAFPWLARIDVLTGMSDDIVQRIISPRYRHFQSTIMSLIDMDKVFFMEPQANTPIFGKKYFQDAPVSSEMFCYTQRRKELLYPKRRITAMREKCKFHFIYPFYACADFNYHRFLSLIKSYLLQYNIFVAQTTLEGLLINQANYEEFWAYYQQQKAGSKELPALQKYYHQFSPLNQLNFLRLLFNGKSDYILGLKAIKEKNKKIDSDLLALIERNTVSKTSGWITNWLNCFFLSRLGMDAASTQAYPRFYSAISKDDVRSQIQESFAAAFPELMHLIELIYSQIRFII